MEEMRKIDGCLAITKILSIYSTTYSAWKCDRFMNHMSQNNRQAQPYPVGIFKKRRTSKNGHRNVASANRNEKSTIDQSINRKLTRNVTNSGSDTVKGPLDPIFGQHRAFPVSIETASVDFGKSPGNVMEYLAQVRLEAAMSRKLAIEEGEQEILDDGEDAANSKESLNAQKTDATGGNIDDRLKTLGLGEVLDSFAEEYRGLRKKYAAYRSGLLELNAIELPETQKEWKFFIFNNEPKYDFVAQIIEEGQHMKLLVYFTKWLNKKVDRCFEQWLMMVLQALEQYLNPSDLSVVRGLGKKARKQLRNELDNRNRKIMFYILAVTGKFYGQCDLLEDSDETLFRSAQ